MVNVKNRIKKQAKNWLEELNNSQNNEITELTTLKFLCSWLNLNYDAVLSVDSDILSCETMIDQQILECVLNDVFNENNNKKPNRFRYSRKRERGRVN